MTAAKPIVVRSAQPLPYDFHPRPGAERRLVRRAFRLAAPAAGPDALLAAFGVLLFRYNAQASILLNASRAGAAGETLWRQPFVLATAPGATCRNVLEQAGEFLRLMDAAADAGQPPDRRAEGSRAAIALLESSPSRESAACGDALILEIGTGRPSVAAAFLYDPGLFKAASIERFAGHLGELASHIGEDLNAPIAALPLISPAERRWIESACTGRPRRRRPELVHRSFERRAAAAPEATALRFRDQSLSYGRLNSRANALARRLASRGVGAESRVAVFLEPSLDIAVALLAVLKAGAVYVPLDPSHPAARLRATVEDVAPRLVLTRAHLKTRLPAADAPVWALDDLDGLTHGFSEENLDLDLSPKQTAYIYYTSGTTGQPKGAAASQANLASYIVAARERFGFGPADVMPALARFTFSISMFELMSPLAAGGTLVVLEREHVLDPERLSRTLAEATVFHAGPSLLKILLRHLAERPGDPAAFARVRHASSGGDMVPPEALEGLQRVFFNAEVFVVYGCSEISCMGCAYPVARGRPVERVFVGRPFDGVAVRVLDSSLNLLPAGVAGEIYFAGEGVVKGYLNRPELTAERFVSLEGRRFYRTGDIGRLSDGGELEILGRSDFQVKLRGVRIELGEVEHHLRRAAGVRDGVVTARRLGGDGGEEALVAYVVMEPGGDAPGTAGPRIAAVRRHMAEHLPDYMVPAAYVRLDSLPVNHNMKVDRRALPEPDASSIRLEEGAAIREPRTPTEKRLAGLWTKLLRLDRVGLDDHFFDLGGHSVLGVTLILDVQRELGATLSGMEVLRESLEGQAAICDRSLGRTAPAPAVPAERASGPEADGEFEAFHFGDGASLYGVLTGTSGDTAVLICPPVGHEHLRAHFVLRRLAQRLAASGLPALRFDYYGCGDSLGESIDATCARWRRDIESACAELRRRTGASRITAVGVRLGAALLLEAADGLDLEQLVLWDPACDGPRYRAEAEEAHRALARSWRRLFLAPPRSAGRAELLGLSASDAMLRELEALALAPGGARRRPLKWLATSDAEAQARSFSALAREGGGSRFETIGFDAGWNDVARVGQLMPDAGVSTMLAKMAAERP